MSLRGPESRSTLKTDYFLFVFTVFGQISQFLLIKGSPIRGSPIRSVGQQKSVRGQILEIYK